MATSITYGSTTTAGKSLSKSIADVNPNVSNGVIKEFTSRLNALTTNTLESINRVDKTTIDTDITYTDPIIETTIDGTHIVKVDDFHYNVDVSQSYSATADAETITFAFKTDATHYYSLSGVPITYTFTRTGEAVGYMVGVTGIGNTVSSSTKEEQSTNVYVEFFNDEPTNTGSGVFIIKVPSLTATVGSTVYHSNPVTFTFTVTGAH